MLKIGLSGGIGSGKTTVTDLFALLGVTIIDADEISRNLLSGSLLSSPSSALLKIREKFGEVFFDEQGQLIRSQLKHKIFSSNNASSFRKTLENIMHPLVHQQIEQQIVQVIEQQKKLSLGEPSRLLKIPPAYVIISIPLLVEKLIETSNAYHFDRIIVVDIDKKTQIKRCSKRDSLSTRQIEDIINSQASREQRLFFADDVIDNTLSIHDLKNRISKLHKYYLSLCG